MLKGRKIAVILGARQVGKTTLVEHLIQSQKYAALNFDIEIDKRQFLAAAEMSPDDAISSLGNPEILILDEAQRLPAASRVVKGWHDAHVSANIVMLGSSSLDLLAQATESLTGRNAKLRLPPLLFEEALSAQPWHSSTYSQSVLLKSFQEPLHGYLV